MPHILVLWLALADAQRVVDHEADLRRFPPIANVQYNYLLSEASVRRQARILCLSTDCPSNPDYVHYLTPLGLYSPERASRIETLEQTRHCRDCWQVLLRALNPDRSFEQREAYRQELRGLLGESNYLLGQMPPPIPWWRFR